MRILINMPPVCLFLLSLALMLTCVSRFHTYVANIQVQCSSILCQHVDTPHVIFRSVCACLPAGYAYIINPWLVLVAESLEMFTVHLAWMAAVLFTSSQSTPAIEASTQAVITACHFGVGQSGGASLTDWGGLVVMCRNRFDESSVAG